MPCGPAVLHLRRMADRRPLKEESKWRTPLVRGGVVHQSRAAVSWKWRCRIPCPIEPSRQRTSTDAGVRHGVSQNATGGLMDPPSSTSRHARHGTGELRARVRSGVRHFDSSFAASRPSGEVKYGGGHTGNVCTEDLVNLFESMNVPTGIDLDRAAGHGEFCEQCARPRALRPVTRQRPKSAAFTDRLDAVAADERTPSRRAPSSGWRQNSAGVSNTGTSPSASSFSATAGAFIRAANSPRARHDLLRGSGRRDDAEGRQHVERKSWRRRAPARRGATSSLSHRQRAQLAGTHVGNRGPHFGEHELHLPAGRDRRTPAPTPLYAS